MDPASIAFGALAEEYRRAGRYEEAIDVCLAGLARHPAYLSARVTLGRALIELDQLDEAESELSDVLRAAPENLAAIRALSEIHTRRRRAPAAEPLPVVTADTRQETEADFIADFRQAGAAGVPQASVPLDVPQAGEPLNVPQTSVPLSVPEASVPLDAPDAREPLDVPQDEASAAAPNPDPPPALAHLERFLDRILSRKAERAGTEA